MQKQKTVMVRASHERIGAFALAFMTIFGTSMVAKVNHNFTKEVINNPSFAFSQITERENETARIPVRYDMGLHLPTNSGL